MSTVIDTNVVEMKFDNSQFEKNCRESMSTLDKLKEKISGSNSSSALTSLSKAANNIDLSGLTKSVDTIANRFSTMGIVGMTIISNLTSAAMNAVGTIFGSIKSMIYSGGLTRALNIEQARFQITGLKKDWEALSEDIDYAVSGTAYGFDAAAKAAAQLSASGIEAGESMKKALRGISGVAAMSNAAYEEISPIFTAIAGQGKMMTQQLRQLELKGLNPSASMAEYLNAVMDGTTEASDSVKNYINELTGGAKVGEAAIREFVSDGKINFELFSEAMDSAFGEHAKDANKTFTGVLSNIKAAFARIGADFLTPIVTQESPIVLMLQKVREKVVEIKAALQPLVTVWTTLIEVVGKLGQRMVENFNINKIMIPFYNILHGVINIFQALFRVLSPIGAAIKEVFPKPFYVMVIELTDAFAKFTEHLKISDLHMTQLKIAFKGVFDIAKLLFDAIGTGLSVIFGMTDGMQGLSDAFFTTIANIGLFLSEIAETIRQSETLSEVFTNIKNVLVGFADGIVNAFSAIGGKNADGISEFANTLKQAASPIEVFGAIFKGVFSTIYGIVSTTIPIIGAIIIKFGETVKRGISDAIKAIQGGDASTATNLVTGSLLGFIVYWLKETIKDIDGIVSKVKATLEGNVINLLASLKSTLLTYQKELRAETLLKIAEAVGILAISIVMLTGINQEDMAGAVGAIGLLLGMVALITSHLMRIQGPIKNYRKFSTAFKGFLSSFSSTITSAIQISAVSSALMSIATSVLLLSVGVKMLASLKTEDLIKGTLAVTVLLGEMVLLAKFLTANQGEIVKGIGKLIPIAIAIDLLVVAVKQMAEIDTAALIKGLAGVGALLLEISIFAKLVNNADIRKVAGKMIALAIGLDLLTIAVKSLGGIPFSDLIQGLLGVGAMLAEIVIFSKTIDAVKISKVALSLIPLSIAMDVLSVAVKRLGQLKIEELVKGLGSIMVLLLAMSKFLTTYDMTAKSLALGAGMILIGIGLNTMIVPIKALGATKWQDLVKGLTSVGVVLLELGIFTKRVNPASLIGLSAGLLIFSTALIPFSVAMNLLALLDWGGVIVGLVTIAGAITVLAVASAHVAPLLPAMAGLSAVLLLLGVAALTTGTGIAALASGLIALAGFGVAGVTALGATLSAFAAVMPTVIDLLTQLAVSLLNMAIEVAPLAAEAIVTLLDAMLAALAVHVPNMVDSGLKLLVGILDGFAKGIPQVATSAVNLIVAFLTSIGAEIPRIVDAGFNMIVSFIEGMAQSIRDNTPLMINAVNELMEAVIFALGAWIGNFLNGGADLTGALIEGIKSVDGPAVQFAEMCDEAIQKVKDKIKDIKEAAANFIQGFIDGITGKKNDVSTAAAGVGNAAVEGLNSKNGIDSHSPSDKTTTSGENFGQGFINGMQSKETGVYNEGLILGQNGVDGLEASGYLDYLNDINKELTKNDRYTANEAKKEQIEIRKKNSEVTKEETTTINDNTTSLDNNTEATKKNGGATKQATEEVKDLTDAFKTLEKGSKVNLKGMTNSLVENTQETARWAQDMKDLMGKGYDKAITDWVMKMGVAGHETVIALKNGSAEEVAGLNAAMQAYLTLDEKAEEYILGKYDNLGGLMGQVLNDSVMTWSTKLAETIQNAVDPFKEFDDKTELSSEKMLENMRSQITGITQWSDNVTSLFGRVPQSLIEYFSELGPASYEEVNAMAHMTEGQLAEAVSLWEQQLALGQTLAIQQAQKYKEVGMSVSQGLEDGIDFDKAREDGVQLANEVIDGSTSKDGFDINSPSKKFLSIGQSVDEGLDKGIALKGHTPVNQIIIVCTNVINEAQRIVNLEAGKTIGSNLAEGMKSGIEGTADSVVTAIGSLCSRLIEKANSVLDERSPSHVFEKIGKFVDLGMAKGIDLSANTVYTSIDDMASSTIDRMSLVIAQISENLNNEFDGLSPVITPVMDLTELQNGKNYMNSMFNNSAYRMASSIASDYSNARTDSSIPILPNNSDVVSAINDLRTDLNSMTEQITNMQVMLDGQTLVGELTPAIDSALGTNAMRVGRGN